MSTRLALLGCASALTLTAVTPSSATAADISISCGAVGLELTLCEEGVQRFIEATGGEHNVTIVSTPNSSTDRLALYQRALASGDIDVLQIDVVWPGILSAFLVDLNPHIEQATLEQHFAPIVENNTVDGALVAVPWFTDAGVLYYRSDLLEQHGHQPPETWEEMQTIAQEIAEAEDINGFVFQGRAYEGLTCNALEWVNSFGGGSIVNEAGEVTINNPQAIAAIDSAASWIGGITPQGVLNYDEEQARGVFQSGEAVFMRNWPYAWSLANSEDSPIRGKVGVVPLPHGPEGESAATLGGWQLAVNKNSNNIDTAIELVRFLTSEDEQKIRAIQGSYNPTIASLYQDEEVLEAVPFFGELYDVFTQAVARPSSVAGTRYNQVSSAFWEATHSVLSGNDSAEDALSGLERELSRLARRF